MLKRAYYVFFSQSIDASFVLSAEEKDLEQFVFESASQHWRKKKDRGMFAG